MPQESTYTPQLAHEICEELSNSDSGFNSACLGFGIVPRTAWRWLNKYPEFWELYVKAREFQTELLYDEISRIAYLPLTDNGEEDGKLLEGAQAIAEIQRRKLIIYVLQFKLTKLQPKRFGDNRNVSVDVGVKKIMTPDDMLGLRQSIIATINAQKRDAEDIEHEDITLE